VIINTFGTVLATTTSQNVGAKNLKRVKEFFYKGALMCFISGAIVGILTIIFAKQLASIFTPVEEVSDLAAMYIQTVSIEVIICTMTFPLNALFIGSGKSIFPTVYSLIAAFAIRVPLFYLFGAVLQYDLRICGLIYPIAALFILGSALLVYFKKWWIPPFLKDTKMETLEVNKNVVS
jgi:Na+-driven multidrug efflux pump